MNATASPVTINYQPCDSSQVAAWGYDPASQTLGVKFRSGGTYHYLGVPQEVATALAAAESLGKFVGQNLRNKFEYERQPDDATGIVFGLPLAQEPKYTTTQHGRLVTRATGKPIPDDEPVFILRAQDVHAVSTIRHYLHQVQDGNHAVAVAGRLAAFERFAEEQAARLKEPTTVLTKAAA